MNHFTIKSPTIADSKNTTIPKRVLQSKIIRGTNQIKVKSVHEVSDQIKFVEKLTVFQSNSISWKSLQAGRILVSNAHEVLHTNQNNLAKRLMYIG